MPLRCALILGAACVLALGAPAVAAGGRDPAAIADACAACHGPDGRSTGAIPSIAGQPAADLAAAMRAFRVGERPATVMTRIAKGFDDAEIEALAAYLGGLR